MWRKGAGLEEGVEKAFGLIRDGRAFPSSFIVKLNPAARAWLTFWTGSCGQRSRKSQTRKKP